MQLIRQAGRSNACVLVDTLHFIRAGHTPSELHALELPYLQVSDAQNGERRIPGEGELPLGAVLDAVPESMALSVEVVPPKAGTPPDWARRVLEGTRRFIEARASRRSA